MVARLIVILSALALAGCATTGTPCDGWTPIRPTGSDTISMSGSLAGQILSHNTHGAKLCGWKP